MANQVAKQPKLTDLVLKRVNEMQGTQHLSLPKNYNASNALNAAYLELQKVQDRNKQPALDVCSPDSIMKSLLDMVLQGLSPAKDQCYFIVYGKELQMQRSYFGTVAAVKRLEGVKKVRAEVVHQDDEFEIGSDEDMETVVTKFKPSFANLDKPIVGAFALIKTDEGKSFTVMTKAEIDKSWAQTRQKNNKVQQNFGQEMAKRTVLNRAAKMFINTSDDSDLLTGAINDTTSNEYDDERRDVTPEVTDSAKRADDLVKNFKQNKKQLSEEPAKEDSSDDSKPDQAEKAASRQEELFEPGTIQPAGQADGK